MKLKRQNNKAGQCSPLSWVLFFVVMASLILLPVVGVSQPGPIENEKMERPEAWSPQHGPGMLNRYFKLNQEIQELEAKKQELWDELGHQKAQLSRANFFRNAWIKRRMEKTVNKLYLIIEKCDEKKKQRLRLLRAMRERKEEVIRFLEERHKQLATEILNLPPDTPVEKVEQLRHRHQNIEMLIDRLKQRPGGREPGRPPGMPRPHHRMGPPENRLMHVKDRLDRLERELEFHKQRIKAIEEEIEEIKRIYPSSVKEPLGPPEQAPGRRGQPELNAPKPPVNPMH